MRWPELEGHAAASGKLLAREAIRSDGPAQYTGER